MSRGTVGIRHSRSGYARTAAGLLALILLVIVVLAFTGRPIDIQINLPPWP
ncbi:MAG TPA: hypothetical protein VEG66_05190 [Thermoplasmata archaeon]|nr:hypothetical protein [Thermoplasmata archaeon]